MSVPTDRKYTAEHEWLVIEGDVARVGITEHASRELGDVVYVELPNVGDELSAGQACGEIESTKSVSEIFAPASGTVVATNQAVVDSPEIVNAEPYDGGWLFELRVSQIPEMLDSDAYASLTSGSAS